jgi:DNA-binding NarL/FixJ family response regulator
VRRNRPQVVLVDAATSQALSIVRSINAEQAPPRIVALTVDETEAQVLECVEAGAAAYLTRDGGGEQLVETIEAAGRGELRCSPQVAGYLMRRVRTLSACQPRHQALAQLTARQRDVLSLLGDGLSNKEIARELHIEVATVKNHVHHILEKLQVQRRAEAMALLHQMDEPML